MNSSSKRELPDDFECSLDLPDAECSAVQKQWSQNDTHVTCWKCGLNLFELSEREDGAEFSDDADTDDDESDFVDEVTVAQADVDVIRTPEEAVAIRGMEGLDTIKASCRISPIESVQKFGEWVHRNRFEIQGMYVVLQLNKNFFRSSSMERRMFVIAISHARFIDQYEVPIEVYEHFDFDAVKINKMSERAFEEYTGKEQPRVLMWMQLYGRNMDFADDVIKMAIDMWDSADPVYVAAEDQVRALVWLALTEAKMAGKKIVYSALSKRSGFDSRVISRVAKVYAPYFE